MKIKKRRKDNVVQTYHVRRDNPKQLSRIQELLRLKKQELAEKNPKKNKEAPKEDERTRILLFEIGPTCRVCGYRIGPDWKITPKYIECPSCGKRYKRSTWSGGK